MSSQYLERKWRNFGLLIYTGRKHVHEKSSHSWKSYSHLVTRWTWHFRSLEQHYSCLLEVRSSWIQLSFWKLIYYDFDNSILPDSDHFLHVNPTLDSQRISSNEPLNIRSYVLCANRKKHDLGRASLSKAVSEAGTLTFVVFITSEKRKYLR